jgi:hypothetical protein
VLLAARRDHYSSSRKGRTLVTAPAQTSKEAGLLQRLMSDRVRDRQPRRRYRKHQRANATSRAFAGAKLVLGIPVQPKTQAQAAELVGSTRLYVAAATALLEAEAPTLMESVLCGNVSLLEAAKRVRGRAQLVKAYRQADLSDRKALSEVVGADSVFDDVF